MKQLIDWYWNFGIKRGQDQNDRNCGLRKIDTAWYDEVMQIVDRYDAIKRNTNQKCCLALWGPSQSGKSTMLSRYIDGVELDGSDSALAWSAETKTRFSRPSSGNVPEDTVVFNPYNHMSDATGVATRYTLKSAASADVDPEYPVEVKFTSRAQIIQSLAFGYLSECKPVGEEIVFTQEKFKNILQEYDGSAGDIPPTKEAYLLLKDIANVIEIMKGTSRFKNLFLDDKWNKDIRCRLVSSSKLLSDKKNVEEFLEKIFWDSAKPLTDFYEKATDLLSQLENKWRGFSVLTTMEVGALIVDIASFDQDNLQNRQMTYKWDAERKRVCISVDKNAGNPEISGENFGYFQAICGEVVVPLKKENITGERVAFLDLVQKCDILDFPGVSNKNPGQIAAGADAVEINAEEITMPEICKTVFKQGKTQCIVYNYIKQYGIDAFAVLVKYESNPSQANLLNTGIGEWLRSFDPNWKPDAHAPMPLFVNLTKVAKLVNDTIMNDGVGKGLEPVRERIKQLSFANPKSATFFVTTYPWHNDGEITSPVPEQTRDKALKAIMQDKYFSQDTGLKEEDLEAVCREDGGLDRMIKIVGNRIDSNNRIIRCRSILTEDKKVLLSKIKEHLPADKDLSENEQREKLRQCKERLDAKVAEIEKERANSIKFCDFANELNAIFSVSFEVFAPLPLQNAIDEEREKYVDTQIDKWHKDKLGQVKDMEYISGEDTKKILSALRDSLYELKEELLELLNTSFSQLKVDSQARAARLPFSIAFGNLLQKGTKNLSSDEYIGNPDPTKLEVYINARAKSSNKVERNNSPYYNAIIAPLLDRLEKLSETAHADERPPQPGDNELNKIYDEISKQN